MASRSSSNSSSRGSSARRTSKPAPAASSAKTPPAKSTPASSAAKAPASPAPKVWPSVVNENAQQAILQTRHKVPWDAISVSYRSAIPVLTFAPRNIVVFDGAWELEYQLDGKPLLLSEQWDWVAWHQDADVDFIELQQQREDGLRIERQILLSRRHRFALLADSLANASASRIDYCTRLPLAPGVQAQRGRETREIRCRTEELAVRLFPLYLPQNLVQSCPGTIQVLDQGNDEPAGSAQESTHAASREVLEVRHVFTGTGAYLPILLDWSPDRRRTQAQWTSLTVTEDGQVVSGDVASGYRLKLGEQHLVVYHGSRPSETGRAVLGLHTRNETLIGNFTPKGAVEQLLAIV